MRKCRFCRAWIEDEEKICRYCDRDLQVAKPEGGYQNNTNSAENREHIGNGSVGDNVNKIALKVDEDMMICEKCNKETLHKAHLITTPFLRSILRFLISGFIFAFALYVFGRAFALICFFIVFFLLSTIPNLAQSKCTECGETITSWIP